MMAYPGGAPVTLVGGQTGGAAAGSAANPFVTRDGPNPATIATGQAKIATAGTAVQLPSQTLVNGIVVKADAGNSAKVLIGSSTVTNTFDGTGNGYILSPGEAASFAVQNLNAIWFNGPSGAIVSWEGN